MGQSFGLCCREASICPPVCIYLRLRSHVVSMYVLPRYTKGCGTKQTKPGEIAVAGILEPNVCVAGSSATSTLLLLCSASSASCNLCFSSSPNYSNHLLHPISGSGTGRDEALPHSYNEAAVVNLCSTTRQARCREAVVT